MTRDSSRPLAAVVMGTRPEAVKLAPVQRALIASGFIDPLLVSTGQHRDMLDQMLSRLELIPSHDLAIMRHAQDLSALTGRLVDALGGLYRTERPDLVIVQGDTTSALCGALAAFYERIPVAHVEAGLRSGVPDDPFPEEANRRLIASLARWHFAPTVRAALRLATESVPADRIAVVGNTAVDSVLWARSRGLGRSVFRSGRRGVLVTLHRRENQGGTMRAMARALMGLAEREDVEVAFPVHRNPAVREAVYAVLGGNPKVNLTDPLDYFDFAASLAACSLVLTDSGGVQEEAPTFGKPVLVLRNTTERPEGVEVGAARLVGTEPEAIRAAAAAVLDDPAVYRAMAGAPNPYGDGRAGEHIVARLARDLAGRAP